MFRNRIANKTQERIQSHNIGTNPLLDDVVKTKSFWATVGAIYSAISVYVLLMWK